MSFGLQDAKLVLLEVTGLGKDALHVYVGLAVLIGSALLGRWQIGDRRPLFFVVLAAFAGEIWDLVDNVRTNVPMRWRAHAKDIANTMFWPGVLTLLVRTRLFRPGQ